MSCMQGWRSWAVALSGSLLLWGCSGPANPANPTESSVASKPQPLSATSVTQSADELRTSWYPDQPLLSPSVVAGPTFGQLFSAAVDGAVYAQPLVDAGTLLVVTETNNIYGLDPETGAIRWTRNVGSPFASVDVACGDLTPSIGITGTPVIDSATHIAYFVAKRYTSGNSGAVTIETHAVDVRTGAEQSGFPVAISGAASDDPTNTFVARTAHQRPGLLLLNGVVYAAFGSHCDASPWEGWVAGVSTSGRLTTLWSAASGPNRIDGAGIWQSGGGLVSDGNGQILFATGNGGSPIGPIAGHSPPPAMGNSIVRVGVQADGTLKATDFFAPYDALTLDSFDADFAAGGPVGLPAPYFGTLQFPHLMVAGGKQGYIYLLDRDNLGGIGNGPGGGDSAISRVGPFTGFWSKPALWPGNGGYVYMPSANALHVFSYGVDGMGKPTLASVATSTDNFGFSSSSAVVTSNQTQSGTALVWIVWAPDGSGVGAQLRAYDPIPVAGAPVLRYSAPIGQSSKFVPPGVGSGRIYVGTRDGHVRGFGAPMGTPLRGPSLDLSAAVLGSSTQGTATVTANVAVTVTSILSTNADFAIGPTGPTLPVTLAANDDLNIPVTFTPSVIGLRAGSIVLQTSAGQFELAVSGQGQSTNPRLSALPSQLSFGGVGSGAQVTSSVTFTNTGGAPLTINRVVSPDLPFAVSGAPAPGAVLGAGASVTVTVTFSPVALGSYVGSVALDTSAGLVEVPMSGACAPPAHLTVLPLTVDFGAVAIGASPVASFTVANTGGSTLRITRSKPPALGIFNALTALPEGTTLLPGDTLTEYLSFIPTALGTFSDTWSLNGDDGGGIQNVTITGSVSTLLYQINCGGPTVGAFQADQFFSGGGTYESTLPVSTAGVPGVAPAPVYQSERYAPVSYTLPGLTAGSAYTVRLHFAEIFFSSANSRLFNVLINGSQVLTNFDIFAVAGGANKAVARSFVTTANASGQVVIGFVGVKDSPKISGIELLQGGSTTVSAPPTVATPAAVSQNPVTGTTASLSVLGADDGGEAALTYTWSTSGTPPGVVTFSANSSNAGKTTIATFSAAGTYALLATIQDADGSTATSSVNVVVNQTLSGLSVSPPTASVAPLGTQLFTASQADQFGATIGGQPSVAWTVSGGGAISPSGLFTAGGATGGPFTISASGGSISGTASVTVSSAPPVTYHINAGGGAVSPFVADQFFSGGGTFSGATTVATAGVANAAPAAVYQSERYGDQVYTLPGLIAGGTYTVRLHFAEIYFSTANSRLFNVVINGSQVLTSFDVFTAAGGANKAVVRDFVTTASTSGKIAISLVSVKDSAKINGIEVLAGGSTTVSAPPTVATPAAVAQNPVTGTTASLTVLGADDGGEAALTYTWSTVGTPPGVVTFSSNTSNASKNTIATFNAAGAYSLLATIRDVDGSTATSTVNVVVNQTLSGLSISPPTASVAPLGTQAFTATQADQFGAAIGGQPSVTWTVTGGGTISASGLFTAGSTTGGPFTISASGGSISGTASVTVSSAPPVTYHINSGGGAASPFTADQFFSAGGTFTGATTVVTAGVANAAPAAVYQSERYGDMSYALPGLTAARTYTVRLHFAEIFFSAANSRLFNVSINGSAVLTSFDVFAAAGAKNKAVVRDFAAVADASGRIVVSFVGVKDNAKVSGIEVLVGSSSTVSAPPTVATPAAVTQNPVTGTTANLSVLGADDGGEGALTYTWSTSGTPPAVVTFSTNNSNASKNAVATFSAAGTYTLLATIRDTDGATASSSINVSVNQTLSGLSISPPAVSVAPLATQQFTAGQADQFGAVISGQPSVTWTASGGGTISASGLFTAGSSTGGPFTITSSGGGVSGTANVTVSAAPPVTYRVNAGGSAASPFAADQFYSGGGTFGVGTTIVTAGVANAAPAAVYQSERYGNLNYTLPGLTVARTYTVRLHFAEIYFSAANSRLFNVSINGSQVIASLDVFAAAGGKNKALVRDFSAVADASGRIVVSFVGVKDNAKVNGIEVFP